MPSLPTEVYIAERDCYYDLHWACAVDNQLVQSCLLTITNVTDKKIAEANEKKKTQEISILMAISAIPQKRLINFLNSSKSLIAEIKQTLSQDLSEEDQKFILRNLHTLKGNARVFNFRELSLEVHQAGALLEFFNRANHSIEQILSHFMQNIEEKLNFILHVAQNKLDINITETSIAIPCKQALEWIEQLEHGKQDVVIHEIRSRSMDSWRDLCQELEQPSRSIAKQLGKPAPIFPSMLPRIFS